MILYDLVCSFFLSLSLSINFHSFLYSVSTETIKEEIQFHNIFIFVSKEQQKTSVS